MSRTSSETESFDGLRRDIAAIIADGVGGDICSDTIAMDIVLYLDLRSALRKSGHAPCLDLTTRYRKALEQIAGRVPQKHPLYFRIVCPACQWKSVEPHTEARHAPNCAGEVARAALAGPDTSTDREGK